MNYDGFDRETKKFFNKAMDIYSTIKEFDINQVVREYGSTINYQFAKLDKKILSLFIAGLIVDGNLKNIFQEYHDIKLVDLLSFVKISEDQIEKLDDDEYSEFYSKNFKLDIMRILKASMWKMQVNYITPEVIVRSLQYSSSTSSKILDYFGEKYSKYREFYSHPIFGVLENYALLDGSLSEKDSSKGKNIGDSPSLLKLATSRRNVLKPTPTAQSDEKQLPTINFDDESIWALLDDIQKKFIGQEAAAEGLFYNIVNNQLLSYMEEIPDGQRSIIFLDGPTGTGKTAITREITGKLGIPFTATTITNYSATGYVGGNITDVLKDLYKKANEDIEMAQRGIVVFDEFDKIAQSRSGTLEMKRAVQQQLLDFLGGGKYTIRVGDSVFEMEEIEFDTSKLTFICLGALTDLRSQKNRTKTINGFGQSNSQVELEGYTITPQDLIGIGIERELVGRFNTYLHTNDYSKENLVKILRESTISPLIGFKQWIESRGKKLEIDEDVYALIAEQAYELNTGARSLQTVMNNIRTPFIKEVLRGTSPIICLDSETVLKINGQTMTRKARG